ncbi:MAG TPA: tetratricopeptide repeat-containing glycosyltransferase family protein [Crinalium sp.]
MNTVPESIETALQLHRSGQNADAAYLCRQLLRDSPDDIKALLLLGIIASQTAQFDEAIACFRRVLKLKPNDANTHNNLGNAFRMKGNLPEAITHYQKAIAIKPGHADAYYNMGIALQESGDPKTAAEYYQRALALQPNFPAAFNGLGIVFRAQGKLEEAIACHQQALALAPKYAEAYDSLGNALRETGQTEEALNCHQQAIAIKPTLAVAHYNQGNTLLDQGKPLEAIACYNRAIELNPPYHEARLAKAMSLLLSGDLANGFIEYEARWGDRQSNPCDFGRPMWDGSPLNGRTILLVREQGLGDTIQFIRYAKAVAQQGGTVIAGCQDSLVRLVKTVPGVQQVICEPTEAPQFDVYAPLMSLPRLLNTDLATVPAEIPYLSPPADHSAPIHQTASRLKVGIVWGARDSFSSKYPSRRRSCPLIAFQQLLKQRNIAFYSLQKGAAEQELAQLGWQDRATDLSPYIHDFADTAAIANQLDLIITVDTSVAHLAGALGKPVWILLPFAPDWRWMLERPDSPWYPSMRLFRQRYPGDWAGVMASVADALAEWGRSPQKM